MATDDGNSYDNQTDASRAGNWMQTFGGNRFYPLDPRPDEVCIVDIAHSLSLQCRYAGHCLRFYSVAEHSVHISYLVPEEHALVGLMHDATEAYCSDIIRPLKPALTNHAAIEHDLWQCIARRYDLPPMIPDVVKYHDTAILHAEREQNMHMTDDDWMLPPDKPELTLQFWDPDTAKQKFLTRFEELYLG